MKSNMDPVNAGLGTSIGCSVGGGIGGQVCCTGEDDVRRTGVSVASWLPGGTVGKLLTSCAGEPASLPSFTGARLMVEGTCVLLTPVGEGMGTVPSESCVELLLPFNNR